MTLQFVFEKCFEIIILRPRLVHGIDSWNGMTIPMKLSLLCLVEVYSLE
jgi:hypothetical protein